MHDDSHPGWYKPVYHAIAAPQSLFLAGVPQAFLLWDVLGTLAMMMVWWPAVYLGFLTYIAAMFLTKVELQWWAVWWRYVWYCAYYEG